MVKYQMHEKLFILGASGHGNVVYDIAKGNKAYREILFLDDDMQKITAPYDIKYRFDDAVRHVVGDSSLSIAYRDIYDAIVAIGNSEVRMKIQEELLRNGVNVISLVHMDAVLGTNVFIERGTAIMAGVVVNCDCNIGKGVILNTSCSVDHDCSIGNYCHISIGSHVAGNVKIGDRTTIGAGGIVINNVSITDRCMIGAGATVTKNITQSGVYLGTPARLR